MDAENKISNKFFKPDRRSAPRSESTERRIFLRPTSALRWRGLVAATLVILVIYFIVILLSH